MKLRTINEMPLVGYNADKLVPNAAMRPAGFRTPGKREAFQSASIKGLQSPKVLSFMVGKVYNNQLDF